MKALMIKDLPRHDELSVEGMRTVEGGFVSGHRLDETNTLATGAGGPVEFNAATNVIDAIGEALATVAQKQ
jgi:hypothetical protein